MRTIRIEIKDSLFEKVISFFDKLPKNDFKLISDESTPSNPPKKLSSISIKTKGYKFDRDEANER